MQSGCLGAFSLYGTNQPSMMMILSRTSLPSLHGHLLPKWHDRVSRRHHHPMQSGTWNLWTQGLTWAGTVLQRPPPLTWILHYGRRRGSTATKLLWLPVGKWRAVVRHHQLPSFFCLHRHRNADCRQTLSVNPFMDTTLMVWQLTHLLITFVTEASMVWRESTNCWRKKSRQALLKHLSMCSFINVWKYAVPFVCGEFAVRCIINWTEIMCVISHMCLYFGRSLLVWHCCFDAVGWATGRASGLYKLVLQNSPGWQLI